MPESSGAGVQPSLASPDKGAIVHTDTTAKWFLISAISYFFIVGIIGHHSGPGRLDVGPSQRVAEGTLLHAIWRRASVGGSGRNQASPCNWLFRRSLLGDLWFRAFPVRPVSEDDRQQRRSQQQSPKAK